MNNYIDKFYDEYGFYCTPLRKKSKRPVWKNFKKVKSEKEDILKYFSSHPKANLGIITGKFSKLLALNVDGTVGEKSLKKMSSNEQINTLTVKTGKGLHYYFHLPDMYYIRRWSGIREGIDILGMVLMLLLPDRNMKTELFIQL